MMRRADRDARGFTTVETAVALGLVVLLIGIVAGVIAVTERIGARSEADLEALRGLLVLVGRLERDLETATRVETSDRTLRIEIEGAAGGAAAPRPADVRYRSAPDGRVFRAGGADADRGRPVSGNRVGRVSFAVAGAGGRSVELTVGPVGPRGRIHRFRVSVPRTRPPTSWCSAEDVEGAGADGP
jgi:type II secretory pathway component PulJ